ncbi:hypothetical protein EJB05_20802, partial [Eragrostis curvula]
DPQVPSYSGRTVIRLGSVVAWSFFISFAVTLLESRDSDCRFCRSFRCLRPALDTREFETFNETKAVKPMSKEDANIDFNIDMDVQGGSDLQKSRNSITSLETYRSQSHNTTLQTLATQSSMRDGHRPGPFACPLRETSELLRGNASSSHFKLLVFDNLVVVGEPSPSSTNWLLFLEQTPPMIEVSNKTSQFPIILVPQCWQLHCNYPIIHPWRS